MTRRRALAAVFGVLIAVFVVSSLITVKIVRDRLLAAVDDDLAASVDAVGVLLEQFPVETSVGFGIEMNERALVIYEGRDEVAFVPAGSGSGSFAKPALTASSVVARVGEPFTVGSERGDLDYRVLATELSDGRFVAMAEPLDGLRSVLAALSTLLFVTLGAVVTVLGLIFWVLLRASLRPYADMIDTAQAIADGDLSRRAAPAAPYPELERLTDSINTMLDRIEESFAAKESAESRLQQFVADASHELRTPLTTVRGYSEVYLSGAATDAASVQQQMTRINAEAARMGRLVDELLMLARLDQSQDRPFGDVDLVPIVADAVADASAASPGHAFSATIAEPQAIVDGDADALRQVMANLLTNARVHTPAGTTVEVALASVDDRVRISVSDTGPGMDVATTEHVFDRFYRADKARTRALGGSGLGLSIAAAVIDVHGGTISVESSPGSGTTFTFEIPRRVSVDAVGPAARAAE